MTAQDEATNVQNITTAASLRQGIDLSASVWQSLATLNLPDTDKAAVRLAVLLAAAIDEDPDEISAVGPKLLDVLEALGATPRARSRFKSQTPANGKLATFRAVS